MNKKGFTLIELLVVVAIIGLLSTLAVVALGSAREKARDSHRISDIKHVQTALELYYTENSSYPSGEGVLGSDNFACLDSTGFHAAGGCTSPYIAQVPSDPSTDQAYTYSSTASSTFSIGVTLEGTIGNLTGQLTASPSGIQ